MKAHVRTWTTLAALGMTAALAFALEAPASGDREAAPAAAKRVNIRDDFFSPRTVRVRVRGRVTWVWKGDNPHNVTFRRVPKGASKRRASTRTSGRFTRSFGKAGRYRYVCTIHEDIGMRGTVLAG
jgi:plastocyanin